MFSCWAALVVPHHPDSEFTDEIRVRAGNHSEAVPVVWLAAGKALAGAACRILRAMAAHDVPAIVTVRLNLKEQIEATFIHCRA